MSPTMNLLFEVGDLAAASPATVSRCGMVYMEPHQLGWKPLLASWLASLPSHLPAGLRARLQQLFTCYGAPLMRFLRRELKHVKEANPTTDGSLATAWMRLLQAMALPIIGAWGQPMIRHLNLCFASREQLVADSRRRGARS